MGLTIEYVPIGSIKPYDGNAKIHTTEQIEQIAKSIQEFGFNDPIAVVGDTICEGHGRLYAAQQLGMSEVPVIRLDHLTDAQRRQYTLIHNQLTLNSDFDLEMLNKELEDLSGLDLDLSEFGLDFDTLESEPQDVVEDEYNEEPPTEPKAKLGDIYQLGRHRLMCGDSTKAENVKNLTGGGADGYAPDRPAL